MVRGANIKISKTAKTSNAMNQTERNETMTKTNTQKKTEAPKTTANAGRTMDIQIEKGIPVPTPTRKTKSKYPFADMNVEDSFYAPIKLNALRQAAYKAKKELSEEHGEEVRFYCQEEGEGTRCWRTK